MGVWTLSPAQPLLLFHTESSSGREDSGTWAAGRGARAGKQEEAVPGQYWLPSDFRDAQVTPVMTRDEPRARTRCLPSLCQLGRRPEVTAWREAPLPGCDWGPSPGPTRAGMVAWRGGRLPGAVGSLGSQPRGTCAERPHCIQSGSAVHPLCVLRPSPFVTQIHSPKTKKQLGQHRAR